MRAVLGDEVTCTIPLPHRGADIGLGAQVEAVDEVTGERTVVVPFVAATFDRQPWPGTRWPDERSASEPVATVTVPGPSEPGDYLLTWRGDGFEAPVPLIVLSAGPVTWPPT